MTKEYPVLFSNEMVKAILDRRKDVTRRVIKEIPSHYCLGKKPQSYGASDFAFLDMADPVGTYPTLATCPYGGRGDLLWVKETWLLNIDGTGLPKPHDIYIEYKAEDSNWRPHSSAHIGLSVMLHAPEHIEDARKLEERHAHQARLAGHPLRYSWRSSRFMPKWVARIWLEIVSVRAERLHEITDIDAEKEGCLRISTYRTDTPCLDHFPYLWDSLNAKRGYGWDTNPWVWRIEFKLVNKKE